MIAGVNELATNVLGVVIAVGFPAFVGLLWRISNTLTGLGVKIDALNERVRKLEVDHECRNPLPIRRGS